MEYHCNYLTPSIGLQVTVYFQERSIELEIPSKATARDLALRVVIINRLQYSHEWTLFECLKTYNIGTT